MRLAFFFCTFLVMEGNALSQYVPFKVKPGVVVPGEPLIELIVPKFSISRQPFTGVLKEISRTYGIRFAVEIIVNDRFIDPMIALEARSTSLRDLFNRIVRQTGFDQAEWNVGKGPDLIEIRLGRNTKSDYPMAMYIDDWSAPRNTSPENALLGLFWDIPELRQRFRPGGVIGSRAPYVSYGCEIVFKVDAMRLGDVIAHLAQIANKSWILVFVQDDEKLSELIVF